MQTGVAPPVPRQRVALKGRRHAALGPLGYLASSRAPEGGPSWPAPLQGPRGLRLRCSPRPRWLRGQGSTCGHGSRGQWCPCRPAPAPACAPEARHRARPVWGVGRPRDGAPLSVQPTGLDNQDGSASTRPPRARRPQAPRAQPRAERALPKQHDTQPWALAPTPRAERGSLARPARTVPGRVGETDPREKFRDAT